MTIENINEKIESIFANFSVAGESIPVRFMYYFGHDESYVVYQQVDADSSIAGDDGLLAYADYYDFDVYAKGNYFAIIDAVTELLEANDFYFEPSRSSEDMYEEETGYFHNTLNFQFLKGVQRNG